MKYFIFYMVKQPEQNATTKLTEFFQKKKRKEKENVKYFCLLAVSIQPTTLKFVS